MMFALQAHVLMVLSLQIGKHLKALDLKYEYIIFLIHVSKLC